ncbi:MAG: TolC family protein [Chitinophagaceae bacterium]|nr:MAG: TolC family protein [Chitinophagaceae bacterium]
MNKQVNTICTALLLAAILIVCILPVKKAVAQDNMLETYQDEAASNNANLQAYYYQYLAGVEKIVQTRLLPMTELSAIYFPQPLVLQMDQQLAGVRAMQSFPWFGTRKVMQESAAYNAQFALEQYQQIRNQLFFDVAGTFYELMQLEEEIRLMRSNIELLESIEQIVITRYETGRASMADLILIEVEKEDLKIQLLKLEEKKNPLHNRFAALLNREYEGFFALPDTFEARQLTDPMAELKDSMLLQHPGIESYIYKELAYAEQQQLARKSGLPSFGIGVEYMAMQNLENNNHSAMFMPMVSLRLPFQRKVYQAREQEAVFNRKAASFQKVQAQNQLITKWEEWVSRYQDAQRRIPLYINQLDRMEQALSIILEDYSAGRKTFDEMLNVQRRILEFEMELVNAKKDNNTAVAGLTYLYRRP